jgi:hypothetical protein
LVSLEASAAQVDHIKVPVDLLRFAVCLFWYIFLADIAAQAAG